MILENIYQKDINRYVNPVVSASDFKDETVNVEIDEYVFTDEIIKGLYKILSEIKDRALSHNGIWINGYFGSGKSHFLKYLKYLFNSKFSEKAMDRLLEAVKQRDPLTVPGSKSGVYIQDMTDVAQWLKTATIDTILFNIETVANSRGNQDRVFLDVFWNEFNRFRGYNNFNLSLAQFFEKKLDDYGKLSEFKQRIAEKGYDWDVDSNTLAITELDEILDIGKELVPQLAVDQIRKAIEDDSMVLSVESFMNELKAYLKDKDDNYRLIFLVDEVSQFIDNHKGLLLQLQTIVEELHKYCDDKIWVSCTAQQDLSQIVQACNINETSEDYGKIMGRFEVKTSLKGTKQEYITQKRILEKNGAAEMVLGKLYDEKQTALSVQFDLPAGYSSFESRKQFIDFYPFVPYQFNLMTTVFEAFVNLGYVDLQVRGTNRNIIQVTHDTAKSTAQQEIGNLISFDQFFNAMFQNSLTARGDQSISIARLVCEKYKDPQFANRIANILFMICNMSDSDKIKFRATDENIATLLMQDIDCQKLALKQQVQDVLAFLCDKNIIHKETAQDGVTMYYDFYSDDERQVADRIKSQNVDQDTMATQLKELLFNYLVPENRTKYETSSFTIGATILGKNYLSNNADVIVEFLTDSEAPNVETFALTNDQKKLVFYMADLYNGDPVLKNNFYWYCQVTKFINENKANDEKRQRTYNEFTSRARELKNKEIDGAIRKMFDTCPVVSGTSIVKMDGSKAKQRYQFALQQHLGNIYHMAKLVSSSTIPTENPKLRELIMRPINPGEYGSLNPMTTAEVKVEEYLVRQGKDMNLKDIVSHFIIPPYGWNSVCTVYIVNELVRRHKREYTYNNNGNIETSFVAANVMNELAKFAVAPAQEISQAFINEFVNAWNEAWGSVMLNANTDITQIVKQCKDFLEDAINAANQDGKKIGNYPFNTRNEEVIDMLQSWKFERDPSKLFTMVIEGKDHAKELIDDRKLIHQFVDERLDTYQEIRKFVKQNQDNWQYLPEACNEAIQNISAIIDDAWPLNNLRSYAKMKKELEGELNSAKEHTREKIRHNYMETYLQLIETAKENQVNYSVDIEAVIAKQCVSDNLSALINHCDTTDFDHFETAKIIKLIQAKEGKDGTGEKKSGSGGTKTGDEGDGNEKKVKQVKINTRSTKIIKTQTDLDSYLETIRKQLQKHIDDGEEIMIM